MTKYHITKKGEVDVCDAQVKCRLGGESGTENHFTNKAVAKKAAEKILKEKYGEIGSVRRAQKAHDPQGSLKTLAARGIKVNKVSTTDSVRNVLTDPKISQVDVVGEGSEKELLRQILSGHRKVSF